MSDGDDLPAQVDARGMRCPWPVLRAAKAMRSSDAVLICADDPRAAAELLAMAQENGWTCEVQGEGVFFIRRD